MVHFHCRKLKNIAESCTNRIRTRPHDSDLHVSGRLIFKSILNIGVMEFAEALGYQHIGEKV